MMRRCVFPFVLLWSFTTVLAQASGTGTTAARAHQRLELAQAGSGPLQPGLSVPQRRTDAPQGWTAEIEAFLKKLLATYQRADSYRDRGRIKLVQVSGRVKTTTEMPMELAFQRPNRLFLDGGQYTVASDGHTLLFVVPSLNQYTAAEAPEKLEKKHLLAGSAMGGAEEGHPELVDFLIEPNAYRLLVSQIAKIGWKPDAAVDGHVCRVLSYETLLGTKVTTFVDTQRMVILRVEAATSATSAGPAVPGVVATPPQPETTLLYEVSSIELNPKLDTNLFRFRPPAGFKRVAQIGGSASVGEGPEAAPPSGNTVEGGHLAGRPAFWTTLDDLAGKPVGARDLHGKVVLLFFWTVGGGEHCLLSIPIVQDVADRFKGQPNVLVLGVSGDEDQPQLVKQLMERKKAAFRTVLDEGAKLRLKFELGGVPTFVVIGPDGIVKWAMLGAPPSLKGELISQIEQCLAPAKR